MKILDVITNEGVFDAFMRGFEKGAGRSSTPAQRAMAGAERGAADLAVAAEKVTPELSMWAKLEKRVDDKLLAQAEKELSASLKAKVLGHYSKELISWMGWANIIGNVAWYWGVAKPALDSEYKKGNMTAAQYQEKLTELRGAMITRIIAPKIALKLGQKVGVNWVLGRLPWLLNASGAKSAAVITRAIGTTTGAAAAYSFFLTPAGQDVLTENLGILVFGVGVGFNATEKLATWLMGKSSSGSSTSNNSGTPDRQDPNAKQDIDSTSSKADDWSQTPGKKWGDGLGPSSR